MLEKSLGEHVQVETSFKSSIYLSYNFEIEIYKHGCK